MQWWKWGATALLALGTVAFSPPAQAQDSAQARPWLDVQVGKTVIHTYDFPYERVLVSDDSIAEVRLLEVEQGQISVRGLAVGTTDIWAWPKGGKNPVVLELTVHQDLSDMVRRVEGLTAEPPRIYPVNGRLVVDGEVSDVDTLERVADIARLYDEDFVNMMRVRGDHQVQLEVTFAEVSRSGLREMGINLLGSGSFTYGTNQTSSWASGVHGPNKTSGGGYMVTGGASNPRILDGLLPAPAAGVFNLMAVITDPIELNAFIGVLEQYNLSKMLAEPTLVSLSGQQAEFLSGGEVPIPVSEANGRIQLEFKEYGVKLAFIPTVLAGEVIDLRVYVEVSEIDPTNSVRITGLEIPAFITRKGESRLRMDEGTTFAMAGLLAEQTRWARAQVPLLGDIPVLGSLFSYVKHQRDETELMIFVTPRLVRPLTADEVPAPPGAYEDNNPNDFELFFLGMDARAGSRVARPAGLFGLER